ncbi:hypothetical protein Tco_1537511, partial [Tanacetum coccineum]
LLYADTKDEDGGLNLDLQLASSTVSGMVETDKASVSIGVSSDV